ncbi:MAG: molybdate ABC transporter substrate-binding protein [Candidatus Eisenbacteria bacterium]|nr:molybdate ABC transporter substrate-binding protein [Candidatus Eisenbacteria bacterium]
MSICKRIRAATGRGALLSLASLLFLSCGGGGGQGTRTEIIVFTAGSLTEAFREIASAFETVHPGARVTLNLAGSHTLATQIVEGAPADLFASANRAQMDRVIDAGRIGEPVSFATNRLIVLVPAGNPGAVETAADLARPGLRLVVGVPGVPAGAYALEALDRLGIREEAERNVVSREETVKAVAAKVFLGEAEAGIVFATDANVETASRTEVIEIPEGANVRARYWAGALTDTPRPEEARAFLDFLLSPEGQALLEAHGFGTP